MFPLQGEVPYDKSILSLLQCLRHQDLRDLFSKFLQLWRDQVREMCF
jgi:hypothetical protein